MEKHSEPKSTEKSTTKPGQVGGLALLAVFLAPIFVIVGIAQAISSFSDDEEEEPTRKRYRWQRGHKAN